MNRQSRRSATQKGITHQDLKYLLYKEGVRVRSEAVRGYSAAVAIVLKDKLKFGKVRIHRTLGQIVELFEFINAGEISLNDIENTLKEECDVVIK